MKKASTNTINQVRAVKYIPLVVYSPPDDWYVVPPNEVVRLVALQTRGQHTENPFESAIVSLRNVDRRFRCRDDALRETTLRAVVEGEEHPELREAMAEVLRDCREVADAWLGRVRSLL